MESIERWGFDPRFEQSFRENTATRPWLVAGRVTKIVGDSAWVITDEEERSVRRRRRATELAVGDFCAVDLAHGTIEDVLPRRTTLARRAARTVGAAQVLLANVDVVFVVTALEEDFSPRRIERFLTLARAGGVAPVAVLTKPDLCDDVDARRREAERVLGAVPLVVASGRSGVGVEELLAWLSPGKTFAFLGSSGVGKSTLINALLGEARMRTSDTAADGRGRHTTTHRELVRCPSGAILADVPGLREVGVVGDVGAVDDAFGDVLSLSAGCRFRDCTHGPEAGCAVRQAVEDGALDAARLRSYEGLRREAEAAERRESEHAKRSHERRTIGKWRKQHQREQRSRK